MGRTQEWDASEIQMISIEKCYQLLNKNKKKYSKEEVIAIRDYLYGYAEIINLIGTKNESWVTK